MKDDMTKIPKERDSGACLSTCSDGANYPWGTSLRFEDELVESLQLDQLKVGDVVEVRGYAVVDGKSSSESNGHTNTSVGIQMTDIKVTRETTDAATVLYGS